MRARPHVAALNNELVESTTVGARPGAARDDPRIPPWLATNGERGSGRNDPAATFAPVDARGLDPLFLVFFGSFFVGLTSHRLAPFSNDFIRTRSATDDPLGAT